MESAKEKAIREAYGGHWDKVKKTVNMETGWCMMYNSDNQKVSENFIDLGFTQTYVSENIDSGYNHDTNTHEWRPKSLQGIETNNGWVETMVLGGIPLESGRYWVVKNGKIDLGYYNPEYNKWMCSGQYYYDTQQNLRITHFQKCTEPNLPIY